MKKIYLISLLLTACGPEIINLDTDDTSFPQGSDSAGGLPDMRSVSEDTDSETASNFCEVDVSININPCDAPVFECECEPIPSNPVVCIDDNGRKCPDARSYEHGWICCYY